MTVCQWLRYALQLRRCVLRTFEVHETVKCSGTTPYPSPPFQLHLHLPSSLSRPRKCVAMETCPIRLVTIETPSLITVVHEPFVIYFPSYIFFLFESCGHDVNLSTLSCGISEKLAANERENERERERERGSE